MESLFELIKKRDTAGLIAAATPENMNALDEFGRTPLHYVITQKAPMDLFEALLGLGANPEIQDKLGLNVMEKAIRFGNKRAVELILEQGPELDHPGGLRHTVWFFARHQPELADLLLATSGSIRLTLTKQERDLLDELLYTEDTEAQLAGLHSLSSPELLHAFVLHFNWDDSLEPIHAILEHPQCQEVTAYEMYDLVDGDNWLDHKDDVKAYDQPYAALTYRILERFPVLKDRFE